MQTFLFSLFFILISVAGLAVGILFRREPLRGGCGSVSCLKGAACGACQRAGEAEPAS
jgi:uncharacterized protein